MPIVCTKYRTNLRNKEAIRGGADRLLGSSCGEFVCPGMDHRADPKGYRLRRRIQRWRGSKMVMEK
jgi:hypothetical protein